MTPPKRRWFAYSLRTLFVVVTVLGVSLGPAMYHARQQKETVALIESLGGFVYYDYEEAPDGSFVARESPEPAWLWNIIGKDICFNVVAVFNGVNTTDETLERVSKLRYLHLLDVTSSVGVTDNGIKHLEGLTELDTLLLEGTSVTEQAAKEFDHIRNFHWSKPPATQPHSGTR
jgi:hypothetical protein